MKKFEGGLRIKGKFKKNSKSKPLISIVTTNLNSKELEKTIQDLISKHSSLEKELSSGQIEKKQYAEQQAKEMMNELRFAKQTDSGAQLLAPQNVPSTISDVAAYRPIDFSGSATPDLTTTAVAQGGRIGAFNGGIQGLMPQQGMPQQGMPQQGFMPQPGLMPPQGLDPRMGYALGDEVEQVTEEITETPENMQTASWEEDYNKWGYQDFLKYQQGGGELPWTKWFNEIYIPMLEKKLGVAQGGRIGAQGGGIMPLLDMGGMEKDYRQEGGFVPIGRREKADDVPARLSKNEFVFTADAVRAAGGGDIDQGAEIMENVMKNLERGGEISEESQGLGGARDMFEVSERLSEVV